MQSGLPLALVGISPPEYSAVSLALPSSPSQFLHYNYANTYVCTYACVYVCVRSSISPHSLHAHNEIPLIMKPTHV